MKREEFYIDKFISDGSRADAGSVSSLERADFEQVCEIVKSVLDNEFNMSDDKAKETINRRKKNAIIGHEAEGAWYKDRINTVLRDEGLLMSPFPVCYPDITEAVFAELYGLAGLAPWAYDMTLEYAVSSSAKIIGDRLYCLIGGESRLQPQRIPKKRREQLKAAFLMSSPSERKEEGFHEVYLHNGIRITIYSGDRTKSGEDIMVFRKYLLKDLTFEKLARYGTIPEEAIDLFKSMIKIGYNTIFAGQVRSGKTTFLQTWQSYEDPSLEGLAIATDPETPWHRIMPDAPIMQLVADGKELESITKSLLRGDNDYVLLEEMRDATAFNIALDITSTGTQRSKATIHDNNAVNIPYKMASKIRAKYGGDLKGIISQIFTNFNYVLEFYQVPENKARKKLRGIVEYRYDIATDRVSAHRICEYDAVGDIWRWKRDIGRDKFYLAIGHEGEFKRIWDILNELEKRSPIEDYKVVYPAYYQRGGNGGKERI
ncbi:MAG: Flp pilus assembly complex ATPase component TadA [Clostridiales bacterium]|nr:Flp pilus assembly complex ATPase component TadA [Clostridiales bacterium]